MPAGRAAQATIAGLDGHHLDHRPMRVSLADPRGSGTAGG
jgi:hypothetical protein